MSNRTSMLIASVLLLSLAGRGFAAQPSGAQEFTTFCARCHGSDATGNGPDAGEKQGYWPANLTLIARSHGGKFPRQEIYDIIDGGKRLPGHYNFDSPMPLWGLSFQLKGKEYSEQSEAAVRARIEALVDYLESIQKK